LSGGDDAIQGEESVFVSGNCAKIGEREGVRGPAGNFGRLKLEGRISQPGQDGVWKRRRPHQGEGLRKRGRITNKKKTWTSIKKGQFERESKMACGSWPSGKDL